MREFWFIYSSDKSGCWNININSVYFPRTCVNPAHFRIRDADVANCRVSFWFRSGRAFVRSFYHRQYWLCWLTLDTRCVSPHLPLAFCIASLHSRRIAYMRDRQSQFSLGCINVKKATPDIVRWFQFIANYSRTHCSLPSVYGSRQKCTDKFTDIFYDSTNAREKVQK